MRCSDEDSQSESNSENGMPLPKKLKVEKVTDSDNDQENSNTNKNSWKEKSQYKAVRNNCSKYIIFYLIIKFILDELEGKTEIQIS